MQTVQASIQSSHNKCEGIPKSTNLDTSFIQRYVKAYNISPNNCTYFYKCTVKQFRSLQIAASVLLSTL